MLRALKFMLSLVFVATTLVVGSGAVSPATAAGVCPNGNWSVKDGGQVANGFSANGVNIRTGDSTACTSKGQGQANHTVVLHCYVNNGGQYLWIHVRDLTIDVSGWVRIDQLTRPTERAC
jgi:hypothetical protein